jgi:hypothetical protein
VDTAKRIVEEFALNGKSATSHYYIYAQQAKIIQKIFEKMAMDEMNGRIFGRYGWSPTQPYLRVPVGSWPRCIRKIERGSP